MILLKDEFENFWNNECIDVWTIWNTDIKEVATKRLIKDLKVQISLFEVPISVQTRHKNKNMETYWCKNWKSSTIIQQAEQLFT